MLTLNVMRGSHLTRMHADLTVILRSRFMGYGNDKQSTIYDLYAAGGYFIVLAKAFQAPKAQRSLVSVSAQPWQRHLPHA